MKSERDWGKKSLENLLFGLTLRLLKEGKECPIHHMCLEESKVGVEIKIQEPLD